MALAARGRGTGARRAGDNLKAQVQAALASDELQAVTKKLRAVRTGWLGHARCRSRLLCSVTRSYNW